MLRDDLRRVRTKDGIARSRAHSTIGVRRIKEALQPQQEGRRVGVCAVLCFELGGDACLRLCSKDLLARDPYRTDWVHARFGVSGGGTVWHTVKRERGRRGEGDGWAEGGGREEVRVRYRGGEGGGIEEVRVEVERRRGGGWAEGEGAVGLRVRAVGLRVRVEGRLG
jgi:hypothetical protein